MVTRLVRSQPKLLVAPEPLKRKASTAGTEALLARAFLKEEEAPILEALGLFSAVFPRHDVRLTLSGRPAKLQAEWLDRAATRYDIDRARSAELAREVAATPVDDLAASGAKADVVVLMLPNSGSVADVTASVRIGASAGLTLL